ncbi:hypothetical protein SVAN01_07003 [Stagonosporopsis vannaccii]|nr:hypothetical protein SVAN01_07003 [Stagonosporopsis vannaccii]
MAAFRSLTADREPLEPFKLAALRGSFPKLASAQTDNTELSLHLFEWSQSSRDGVEVSDVRSVADLEARDPVSVRVIFAPRDVPAPETAQGLVRLFEKFQIPSAFIAESTQDISRSFAAQVDIDGTMYVWLHFLCKTFSIKGNRVGGPWQSRGDIDDANILDQTQEDYDWLKPGCVLKIRKQHMPPQPPARSRTSSSDATIFAAQAEPMVEFICFGAPSTIGDQFRKLKDIAICDDLVQDPYVLLEVVFEGMYKVLDATGWAISSVFGQIEKNTLDLATTPARASELPRHHFTGLHNLAKHVTHLQENCDSALATLSGLRKHHASVTGDHPDPAQEFTRQALEYRKTLFDSTRCRLASLEKRMANVVQLSFHLVTVADNGLMHSENASMKSIAITTLIFLPLGTVASIFGTQFMKLDEAAPFHVRVSQDFWLLWVVALPLTAIVYLIWRVWYHDVRGRFLDGLPHRKEGKRGRLGWKTALRMGMSSSDEYVISRTDYEKAYETGATKAST